MNLDLPRTFLLHSNQCSVDLCLVHLPGCLQLTQRSVDLCLVQLPGGHRLSRPADGQELLLHLVLQAMAAGHC
jgi:hypothetical protein